MVSSDTSKYHVIFMFMVYVEGQMCYLAPYKILAIMQTALIINQLTNDLDKTQALPISTLKRQRLSSHEKNIS